MPADKGLGPSWSMLRCIENNVMCRLARESILADRPSIPRRPSFVPALPIVPRSPVHSALPPVPPQRRQLFRTRTRTHLHIRHTISHLMNPDYPPPHLPQATVDRSHHSCRRLPIGLLHHTPYPAVSSCRLAHEMPINPTPLRVLELPIAGCGLRIVPGRTQRHETIGCDKIDMSEVGSISKLLSSSSEEAALSVYLTGRSIAFD